MKRQLYTLLFFVACSLFAQAQERQWYQVQLYHLNSEAAEALFDKAFAEALLPSLKKQGIGPIGVFKPSNLSTEKKKDAPGRQRYVILPLSSPEQLVSMPEQLQTDSDFREKAADYIQVGKDEAIFSRVESSLLYAFEGMPQLAIPTKEGDAARIFELRIYESYSEMKGKLKVQMFNQGEIDIFKAVGLDAVFFGEAVVGKNLPNLTYMLVYNDEEHRAAVWKKFLSDPAWEKLKVMEIYKDTVSKIISEHMVALPYSAIQ